MDLVTRIIWLVVSIGLFTVLWALVIASAGMFIYMIMDWRNLTKTERWFIGLCVVAWLVLLYGVIHMNGLTLLSMLGL
jgi:hypothetical protein